MYKALEDQKNGRFCLTGIPFAHFNDTLVANIHTLRIRRGSPHLGRVGARLEASPPCHAHPTSINWALAKFIAASTVQDISLCVKNSTLSNTLFSARYSRCRSVALIWCVFV